MEFLFAANLVISGLIAGLIVLYDRTVGFKPPSAVRYHYGSPQLGGGPSRPDFDLAEYQRYMARMYERLDEARDKASRPDTSGLGV